ncbi:MAG TPA: MAPEG family protein [Bosea sp. (in: a-proteobacteria)]|uniref:MAPEG family protein n=1 Tax=Bosea sp. (in: a-proteobacteria) TaxID=1871050 RepID=UPI002E11B205|nr:MAPEG family protein [Bosea sp. (in: a-proteobacteria)]
MAILIVASVILLLLYLAVQVRSVTRERGSAWNTGPRDEGSQPTGVFAGRADRAFRNYLETFPAFGLLALLLMVLQRADGIGVAGAQLWLAARVAYLPLYLAGVPYLRTLVWIASIVGLLLMAIRAVT